LGDRRLVLRGVVDDLCDRFMFSMIIRTAHFLEALAPSVKRHSLAHFQLVSWCFVE
jgi:hypothetical protein